MTRRLAVATMALVVLASGCGGSADSADPDTDTSEVGAPSSAAPTSSPTAPPSSSAPEEPATRASEPRGVTITTGDSAFGTMLFDADDQAIYIWELEPTSEPTCYGDCAVKWPPVLTDGAPVAAGQVRNDLLGTVERRDGRSQVTYNDHPLYYYVDEPPGAVECHDVSTHGGLWWVIQPDGDRAA